jgi:hypothetical protein
MMEKTVVLHLKLEQWELAMGTACVTCPQLFGHHASAVTPRTRPV